MLINKVKVGELRKNSENQQCSRIQLINSDIKKTEEHLFPLFEDYFEFNKIVGRGGFGICISVKVKKTNK